MSIIDKYMQEVDTTIVSTLKSDVALINQLSTYIISSGGKRLRPRLTLLSALACGYSGNKHAKLAAIVEFIHTATLLHDDVVDNSDMRRGQETANSVFGNQAAVLTGDFLYSNSFKMMVEVQSMEVMEIMADTTNVIAEGEVMQLMNARETSLSESDYLEIIYRKTAKLFEAATLLGAVISNKSDQIKKSLAIYGKYMGNAFQIMDDVLDYKADSGKIGKNIGDDLAEGKVTLPLIYALNKATPSQKACLEEAINNADGDKFADVFDIISKTNSIENSVAIAKEQVKFAIESLKVLPESVYREEMIDLARDSVNRAT